MFFLGFAMLKTMFMIVGHAACLEAGLFQDDVSQLHMAYLSFTKFSNLIKPTKLFRVLTGAPTFQAHSIPKNVLQKHAFTRKNVWTHCQAQTLYVFDGAPNRDISFHIKI